MNAPSKFSMPLLLVGFAVVTLVIPIAGFVVFGDEFEATVAEQIKEFETSSQLAVANVAILAADLFLPIPSSVVLTYGGISLGVIPATIAGALGLTISSEIGYWVGRLGGRQFAKRFVADDDFARIEERTNRTSIWWLVLSRPLPLLAEAATIGAGMTGLPHRVFVFVVFVANLWVALTFAALGAFGAGEYQWPVLVCSAALPLAITWLLRKRFSKSASESSEASPSAVS